MADAPTPGAGTPHVFIVESVDLDDEREGRTEGEILSRVLRLSGRESKYFYIRTRRELEAIMPEFSRSEYRYLHISSHGNAAGMGTTLDFIPITALGQILRPHIQKRRVFISACEMTTSRLARTLLSDSGCYSVIGPAGTMTFGDAALLWASFYHLMFRADSTVMKKADLLSNLRRTANLFDVPMNYYYGDKAKKVGYGTRLVRPVGAA